MSIVDKRASSGAKPVQPDDIQQRADGSLRRAGPGTRNINDFFAEKNLDRPMSRRDYANLRAGEEYCRLETIWYRRIFRWLRHWPQVVDTNTMMAKAQARDYHKIFLAMKAKADAGEKIIPIADDEG